MSAGWFKGPEIDPDGNLYRELLKADYAVDPVIRHSNPHTRWVMNLDWYKRIRAEFGVKLGDDDDPDKWEPKPEDTLLGIPFDVRDDGGVPHLENKNYPAEWPS